MPWGENDGKVLKESRKGRRRDRSGSEIRSFRFSVFSSLPFSLSLFLLTLLSVARASQSDPFEKQALIVAQDAQASDLDPTLPNNSFQSWLKQVIDAKADVTWQLIDCGKPITDPVGKVIDLPACAEFNAVLPDNRRVFIAISVGTFKKGVFGKPAFFGGAIEQPDKLYPVRRLHDLPDMLREQDKLTKSPSPKQPVAKTLNRIVVLPAISANLEKFSYFRAPDISLAPSSNIPVDPESPPPVAPPPQLGIKTV